MYIHPGLSLVKAGICNNIFHTHSLALTQPLTEYPQSSLTSLVSSSPEPSLNRQTRSPPIRLPTLHTTATMHWPSWLTWYKKPEYRDINEYSTAVGSGKRPLSPDGRNSMIPSQLKVERVLENKTCMEKTQ